MNYHALDSSFEEFLIKIALTATQAARIDKALEDVTRIMLEDLSGIEIYVQGSFATATTVKPLTDFQNPNHAGEYDVDIVIESTAWGTPEGTLNQLKSILAASETFGENTIEVKSKCVRINFPQDATSTAFHVDVVPIMNDGGTRKVANKDTGLWQESDSQKLVEWFLGQKTAHPYLPAIVMIVKRIRDLGLLTDSIPSIVIQTIAAANYQDKGTYAADLLHVLKNFDELFQRPVDSLYIGNPVNQSENLAERWRQTPADYRAIQSLFANARAVLQEQFALSQPDTDVIREVLSSDFPTTLPPAQLESLRSNGYSINSDNFLGKLEIRHRSQFGRLVDAFTRMFFEINKAIVFTAPKLALDDYSIGWQVLNSVGSPSRRGDIFSARGVSGGVGSSPDMHINHENEQYVGNHWIRYYVLDEQNMECLGRSRKFHVRVRGQQGYAR